VILPRALSLVGRISPALSLLLNRLRFPDVRAGILAEIVSVGSFIRGKGTVVGAFSRIYVGSGGEVQLGDRVMLGRNVHLQTQGGRIEIGSGTSVQDDCRLYGDVSLGDDCILAPNVYASSGNHAFADRPHLPIVLQEAMAPQESRRIEVGDDCWIGINAVIMRGVTVGNGAIIGAGAVVTRDVAPYAIMAGVPARAIGTRLDFKPPAGIDARKAEDWPYFYSGFDKSAAALAAGEGLAAGSRIVLALFNEGARFLHIRGHALSEGARISFNDQTLPLRDGEARFDLPQVLRTPARLELTTNGRVVVASAELI